MVSLNKITVDFAVIGTGLAPLVACKRLIQQGADVVLINPDVDFFTESSELAFDPLIPLEGAGCPSQDRCERALYENMLEVLGPEFPGALEPWPTPEGGFHDPDAAHIHSRHRIWIPSDTTSAEAYEEFFVEQMPENFHARLVDGVAALKRFPGYATKSSQPHDISGILVQRLGDVHVHRYRSGFLEFIQSKLGTDRMIYGAKELEFSKQGIHVSNADLKSKIFTAQKTLIFQTPQIASWVERKFLMSRPKALGARLWEEWSLSTREPIALEGIGVFGNHLVWSDPESGGRVLRVLRAGDRNTLRHPTEQALDALSSQTLKGISFLFDAFLRWEHFSIRRYRNRWIAEFDSKVSAQKIEKWDFTTEKSHSIGRLMASDGPIHEIVFQVQQFLKEVAS